MEPFNDSTNLFIKQISQKANGKTEIRLADHLNRCTLDVIAKVCFLSYLSGDSWPSGLVFCLLVLKVPGSISGWSTLGLGQD